MQGKALIVEVRAQTTIGHPRLDGNRGRLGVERDHAIHRLEREEGMGAVGDPVEAMAGAEHLELIVRPDEGLDVLDRPRRVQAAGAVREIARPVRERHILRRAGRR